MNKDLEELKLKLERLNGMLMELGKLNNQTPTRESCDLIDLNRQLLQSRIRRRNEERRKVRVPDWELLRDRSKGLEGKGELLDLGGLV